MQQPFADPFDRDGLRAGFLMYTRKAYAMLPAVHNPRILDIGCGSGVPTLELRRLSKGMVIGIDIDAKQLSVLHHNTQAADPGQRVACVRCSMRHLPFSDNAFDILWAEGSIAVIGFLDGLKTWRRLITSHGYLVLHDDVDNIDGKRIWIDECGYVLIRHFMVSKKIWWDVYYRPLQEKIDRMKKNNDTNDHIQKTITTLQHEIDRFNNDSKYDGSIFFILQKTANDR